jgi:hypothetical protein
MNVEQLKAQAAAKLAGVKTDTFIDPTQQVQVPIIMQRVVPKVEAPVFAKHVLEGHQANFAIMLQGNKKVMFANYQFQTDDDNLAEAIIRQYAPKVWRVQ